MHLKSTELNTEFINTLINHLDIPAKYITKATFTNHSTQIYLINSSIIKIFFQRYLIARKNTKFAHLIIHNNIPFHTRIRGRIIYHAYINKLTLPNYKPYFNNLTKTHELKTLTNIMNGSTHQYQYYPQIFLNGSYLMKLTYLLNPIPRLD